MMVYVDNDFDRNNPLAKKYLLYKGIYYDVGTKVKIRGFHGVQEAVFIGWNCHTGESFQMKNMYKEEFRSSFGANKYIIEILEPVYADLSEYVESATSQRECPPQHEVEMGWVWYIAIMLFGVLFKDVLMIWLMATAIFFLWKSGFLIKK